MAISETAVVGELAVRIPGATTVFEQFGIDYCCKGGRLLDEACRDAGVSLEVLLPALVAASERSALGEHIDWNTQPLQALTRHIIEKHHAYTREELDRLGPLADKVLKRHGAVHPELLRVRQLVARLDEELRSHLAKEEVILFPYIEELEAAWRAGRPHRVPPFGTVLNPVRMMMLEHDHAEAVLRELREGANGYDAPPAACQSFALLYVALRRLEEDLHVHMHLESNVLFPRAIELEARGRGA